METVILCNVYQQARDCIPLTGEFKTTDASLGDSGILDSASETSRARNELSEIKFESILDVMLSDDRTRLRTACESSQSIPFHENDFSTEQAIVREERSNLSWMLRFPEGQIRLQDPVVASEDGLPARPVQGTSILFQLSGVCFNVQVCLHYS